MKDDPESLYAERLPPQFFASPLSDFASKESLMSSETTSSAQQDLMTKSASGVQKRLSKPVEELFPSLSEANSRAKDLYQNLIPTLESLEQRKKFLCKLQTILDLEFPERKIKAHLFGCVFFWQLFLFIMEANIKQISE
jgi:DNA polymerase sigma